MKMKNKRVIVLTGMPGSGKSLAAKILASKRVPSVGMGDAVRNEMNRLGLKITNRTLRNFAKDRRKKFGDKYVINLVKKEIAKEFENSDTIILDGSRNILEVNEIVEEGYTAVVLGIIADKMVRFGRIVRRKRAKEDFSSLSEFEWREKLELGYGVAEVIAVSDYYILNNSSEKEFKRNLSRMLSIVKKL